MGNDLVRELSEAGYGLRMRSSFSGALLGLLVFIAAFPLEFWNEGRAVARQQALQECADEVQSLPVTQPTPAN